MRRGIAADALLESDQGSPGSIMTNRAIGGASKRLFDMSVALPLLIIVLPLLALLCLLVWCRDFHPPIFMHTRVGRNGRQFRCFKIRSMVPDSSAVLIRLLERDPVARREWEQSQKLQADPRITSIGRILRATSLDELPQLLNVLKGDMSLVGPRPIVDAEIDRYGARIDEYRACRPGLTGLWQISGRSNCSYEERIRLDAEYVMQWSFSLDMSILFKTVQIVLSMDGSY